jgi:predicted nuclease of predicted toxin-antitoxin system
MRLLADEGVDRPIVEQLRLAGHEVFYVAEMDPSISDDRVLELANQQGALLIMADKDFGELVFRLGRIHAGAILIRLAGLAPDTKAKIVTSVLQEHDVRMLNAFTVIAAGMVRIRRRV